MPPESQPSLRQLHTRPTEIGIGHLTPAIPQREATITFRQLANGYWAAQIDLIMPGLGYCVDTGESFHDAAECLRWAEERMRAYVAKASGWAS